MIFGIGVDIVDVSRFERFLAEGKDAIFQRLFTPAENEYCRGRKKSAQHYAIRFAAKEAFFKAIGLGLRDGMSWHDVEVVNNDMGKPDLELGGRSEVIFRQLDLKNSFVSLSHDGTYGVAMVVLER
jgi:holo-[acyl-carrier protein] synthase